MGHRGAGVGRCSVERLGGWGGVGDYPGHDWSVKGVGLVPRGQMGLYWPGHRRARLDTSVTFRAKAQATGSLGMDPSGRGWGPPLGESSAPEAVIEERPCG